MESNKIQNLKEFNDLVLRSSVVAFMDVDNDGIFYRMKGFTDLPETKEVEEYSRKYVDEKFERTDTTGVTSSMDYTFDRYKDNPVHDRMKEVHNKELLASEATNDIVVVDFSAPAGEGKFEAIKRKYSIVPDSAGDGTDAYQFSGSLKATGQAVFGYAQMAEGDSDWLAVKFTEGTNEEEDEPDSGLGA